MNRALVSWGERAGRKADRRRLPRLNISTARKKFRRLVRIYELKEGKADLRWKRHPARKG